MVVLGGARDGQGVLKIEPPLKLPEGARLLIAEVSGVLALIPADLDEALRQCLADGVSRWRRHDRTEQERYSCSRELETV